jgi:hypothetical protein
MQITIHGTREQPGAWNTRMRQGQYAVFFHDARTDLMLDESGAPLHQDGSVAVFDTMAAAEEFAHGTIGRLPTVRAEIFDSSAGMVEKIHSESMERRYDPRRRARHDLQLGVGMVAGAVATAVYAALGNWQSIWAYIIGTKLLIVGTFIISRGLGWYLDHRRGN